RLENRAKLGEDPDLDALLLGGGLDHEIAIAESVELLGRRDAPQRRLAILLADQILAHLARHVAVDGGQARLDAVERDVVEQHGEAGKRAHMSNAVAHLTGTDHTDLANVELHGFGPDRLRIEHHNPGISWFE